MTAIQLSRAGGDAGSRPGGGTSNRPPPTTPSQRPGKALLDSGRARQVIAVAAAIAIVTGFSAPLVAPAWTAEVLALVLLAGLLPLQLLGGELLHRLRAQQEEPRPRQRPWLSDPQPEPNTTKGRVEMTNVPNAPEVAVSAPEPKLPALPGCGQTAAVRIEAYNRAWTAARYGSVNASIYACAEHTDAVADAITAAGLTPNRTPVAALDQIGTEQLRCGDGYDYVTREALTVPGPTTPAPAPEPRAEAFGLVTAGIRVGNLPIPEQIFMYDFQVLQLILGDEDRAAVDRWATFLDLARPQMNVHLHGTRARRWKVYEARGVHPRLEGWHVSVYCTVTEPAGEQPEPAASAQELAAATA